MGTRVIGRIANSGRQCRRICLSASFQEEFLTKHSVYLLCNMNYNYVHRGNDRIIVVSSFLNNPFRIFFVNLQDSFHVVLKNNFACIKNNM